MIHREELRADSGQWVCIEIQIKLNPEGRRIAKRVHDIILALERELLADLSAADLAHCERAFSSIEHKLDTHQATSRRTAQGAP